MVAAVAMDLLNKSHLSSFLILNCLTSKSVPKEETIVRESAKLRNFLKASAYYLEETVSKNSQSTDIERYSDRSKPKTTITRDSLSQILELKKFPRELIRDSRGQQPSRKKVRWNPESGLTR